MKKRILVILLALALALAFSACGGGGGGGGGTTDKPSGGSSGGDSGGDSGGGGGGAGEVTIALNGVPNGLDPISEDIMNSTVSICNLIFDRLMDFDADFNMIPGVANSMKMENDGMTFNFDINTGFTFHNGDPLTMDDVVYSVERLKEIPKSADAAEPIESVTADGNTLKIKLKEANNVSMPKILAQCIIVNKKNIEANGDAAIYTDVIGTGPYMVASFTPGASIVLEAMASHPLTAAKAGKLSFIPIAENTNLYIAVETGQAQYAGFVSAREIELARANDNLTTIVGKSNGIRNFCINCQAPPFDNKNVRLAMSYAYDRASVGALDGGRTPAESMLFTGFDSYRVSKDLPAFDLEKAKELLAAEGYNESNPLKFNINYYKPDPSLEFYQSQLQSIGVDVSIELQEFTVWLENETTDNFQMEWLKVENVAGTPLQDLQRFDPDFPSRNISNWSDPALTALIKQAYVENDQTKLSDLFTQINDIVTQNAPHIPGFLDPMLAVMDKNLSGVEIRPDGVQMFRNIAYNG